MVSEVVLRHLSAGPGSMQPLPGYEPARHFVVPTVCGQALPLTLATAHRDDVTCPDCLTGKA